jgi:sarcosine oxidase subunit gamma
MSNAVSVMQEAEFTGAANIRECGLTGMITVRGDLSDEKLGKAVKAATGQEIPDVRRVNMGTKGSVAWMSPDELLLLVDYEAAVTTVQKMEKSLGKTHSLVVNVSDARAMFQVSGKGARDVLAKGAPIDLSVDNFSVGHIQRTRIAQLAAALWMTDEDSFNVVCFRSVGEHMYNWLKVSAAPDSLPEFL